MIMKRKSYLNGADISSTTLEQSMIIVPNLAEGIQAPAAALPDQSKDGTEVVREDNATEPTDVAQTCSLEDFFFLLKDLFGPLGVVCWNFVGVLVGTTLVDLQDLLSNVLMERGQDTDVEY